MLTRLILTHQLFKKSWQVVRKEESLSTTVTQRICGFIVNKLFLRSCYVRRESRLCASNVVAVCFECLNRKRDEQSRRCEQNKVGKSLPHRYSIEHSSMRTEFPITQNNPFGSSPHCIPSSRKAHKNCLPLAVWRLWHHNTNPHRLFVRWFKCWKSNYSFKLTIVSF